MSMYLVKGFCRTILLGTADDPAESDYIEISLVLSLLP